MEIIKLHGQTFKVEHALSTTVYHRAKTDKIKGIITGIMLSPDGGTVYQVTWADNNIANHFASELSDTYLPDFES